MEIIFWVVGPASLVLGWATYKLGLQIWEGR